MSPNTPLLTGSVALGLVGLDSVPALLSIADRIWRRSPRLDEPVLAKSAYRDEDGEATEESLRAFSDTWQRIAITLFSISGLGVTLALAVFAISNHQGISPVLSWLQLGIWVCRLSCYLGEIR